MPAPAAPSTISTSHTTVAAQAVSTWVEQHYGLPVQPCYLIRRNLNDNYAVRSADGSRYVARLCAIRPRGPFNVDFELALLTHLESQGVGVASPVLAANGATIVALPFPEGPRVLVLFRHCEGAVPGTPEDLHLTGATLAQITALRKATPAPPAAMCWTDTIWQAARWTTLPPIPSWIHPCWMPTAN